PKIYSGITENIEKVGLKKPITVAPAKSKSSSKQYDLVCGQGRLEAFINFGKTHIPAIIRNVSQEDALIMSLVENIARRHKRNTDVFDGIEILRKKGYSASTISAKTGLNTDYIEGIIFLLEHGEDRLLS